ncbi:MAG TPA: sulfotransferase [Dokdonella sp.]|uniref:tetratricopeptide repeat-containing sulfotransferase family protein n=1 Tax=Dokdonella sp. TaxID=2291710 RepID=UPI002D7E4ADC|nr:sulfotransferase [Dokdonella sp.]HET9031678.1 sulfotransferase [Dokdonella sp.]
MQQLVNEIVQAMNNDRHADALRMSRELAQTFPRDEGVRSLLAVSEQNAGDLNVSKKLLLELTSEHPNRWQHWNNLGNVQRLQGELESAGEAYEKALQLNPQSPRLLANLGLLQLNLGNFRQARTYLCKACTLPGSEPGMRIWAAVACQASSDDETARMLIHDWSTWPPTSEESRVELGWLLIQLGDHKGGHAILSGEFQDTGLRMRAFARRVLALERVNQIDEALMLTRTITDPAQIADLQARMETLQALGLIAARLKDHAAARKYYSDALALDLPQRYRRPLCFGLARACDHLGETEAAMEAFAMAHSSVDASTIEQSGLPETGLLSLLDPGKRFAGPPTWEVGKAEPDRESPVFVVGFPRSGTTLLEQMLDAHEAFASTDEQPMVQRMLAHLDARGIAYPGGLANLGEADRATLREIYFKEVANTIKLEPGVRLVDKHPLNFLALPLIRFVFPQAPLIFCQRHPCDSLLSSYMQDFRDPRLAAECSSLQRLADLYVRLTERWISDAKFFPDNILFSRYEELISDPDTQLRKIGDFLGLEDVSAMHEFSKHAEARGFIATPSYSQVVEGLNTDAEGRWKRYREYLQPILPTLTPVLEHWGYDA